MEFSSELPRKQRVAQASARYGVGKSTIWLYIKQGKLHTTKPSSRVTLLDTYELESFFNNDQKICTSTR